MLCGNPAQWNGDNTDEEVECKHLDICAQYLGSVQEYTLGTPQNLKNIPRAVKGGDFRIISRSFRAGQRSPLGLHRQFSLAVCTAHTSCPSLSWGEPVYINQSQMLTNLSLKFRYVDHLVLPVVEIMVEDVQLQSVWIFVSPTFIALAIGKLSEGKVD